MAPPPTPPLQPDCQIAPPSLWPMAMSITMYIESYQWLLLLVNWPQNRAFGCLNEGVWGHRSLRKGWMNISHWYASDTAPAGQKPCNHHCHRSTGPVAPCSQSVTKSVIKSDTKNWFSTDAKKKVQVEMTCTAPKYLYLAHKPDCLQAGSILSSWTLGNVSSCLQSSPWRDFLLLAKGRAVRLVIEALWLPQLCWWQSDRKKFSQRKKSNLCSFSWSSLPALCAGPMFPEHFHWGQSFKWEKTRSEN